MIRFLNFLKTTDSCHLPRLDRNIHCTEINYFDAYSLSVSTFLGSQVDLLQLLVKDRHKGYFYSDKPTVMKTIVFGQIQNPRS